MMKVMDQGRRICNTQIDKDSSAQLFHNTFQISEIGAKILIGIWVWHVPRQFTK